MTETSTGTSVLVADEMVEVAAQAMWERIDREESWSEIYHASAYRRDASAALEAVAPQIAAATLRDAADREMAAWESVPMSPDWMEAIESVCETLRARADQIEKEGL